MLEWRNYTNLYKNSVIFCTLPFSPVIFVYNRLRVLLMDETEWLSSSAICVRDMPIFVRQQTRSSCEESFG